MKSPSPCALTINAGSSSIRFAVYDTDAKSEKRLAGKIDRVGLSGTTLIVNDAAGTPHTSLPFDAADHRAALDFLLNWMEGSRS